MAKRPKTIHKLSPLVINKSPKDDKTRWSALDIVSSVISGEGAWPSKHVAFGLCKAWSVNEPVRIPHPTEEPEECDRILQEMLEKGEDVFGERRNAMQFHCPLMAKYAFAVNDGEKTDTTAWATLKRNLLSLGPREWSACKAKLCTLASCDPIGKEILYPFPDFLRRASEGIEFVCLRDTAIVNELHSVILKPGTVSKLKYQDTSVERLKNIYEMKRWSNIMALFYCLCQAAEIRRWTGLDVVADFFRSKIGDLDAMERHCQVLDVEAATYRIVEWDPDNKPAKMEYILDDTETDNERDPVNNKDEMAWWRWVKNVLKRLHQSGEVCDEIMHARILRMLCRIDRDKKKTQSIILALNEWYSREQFLQLQ